MNCAYYKADTHSFQVKNSSPSSLTIFCHHLIEEVFFMKREQFLNETNPEDASRIQEETNLIVQNFRLIYDNAEEIIKTPEYFYCQLESSRIGSMHIGCERLPLGVLLLLWKEGNFISKCTLCGHDVYNIGGFGNVFSGWFTWWGVCEECVQEISFEGHGFRFSTAYAKGGEFRNEAIIEKGKEPIFSWSKGVVGEYTPDKIIKPSIVGISLKDLIEVLKQKS